MIMVVVVEAEIVRLISSAWLLRLGEIKSDHSKEKIPKNKTNILIFENH